MTPVPKSGDRQIVNDYRPVSVIPITVMINLSKAFDTIKNLFLMKLYAYGIRGSELSWFTDSGREEDESGGRWSFL